ncbi:SprT-like domain-containing protein [Brumicola blandensis]|uniref:SprT-like domain-containing protein n=1 Tax=Brumicola blandensis TaxID=3075611 RepID=A0AAW8R100_9ALTE|nr:SprT-like domain-containing protein [Alteromonas sp. W409]MDT0581505.1 SprT-like domain-containing protein [Alteromonas sp. W409]
MSPTNELYAPLIDAYNHFNQSLFDDQLPQVVFTLQRKKNVMGFFAAKRWGNINGELRSEISINPTYFASSRIIEVLQTLVHEMVHAWQFHFGHPSDGHYHNKEWAQKMMEVGLMPSTTGEPGGAVVGRQMSDFIMKQGRFMQAAEVLLKDESFRLNWVDRLALPKLYEPVIIDGPMPKSSDRVEQFASADEVLNASILSIEQGLNSSSTAYNEDNYTSMPSTFFIQEVARKQTRSKYVCPKCDTKIYGKASLNVICGDCDSPFIKG